jgi:hypothetical protein
MGRHGGMKGERVQGKKKWLVLRGVLIALACLAGSVCIWQGAQIWRVEKAIGRFEREPSQAGSDELFGLLHEHAGTLGQGHRILALLNRRTVCTRSRYAAGRPVAITLERPFHLDFREIHGQKEEIWIDGRRRSSGGGQRTPKPQCLVVMGAEQAEPGTHVFHVRCTYSLKLRRRDEVTRVEQYLRKVLRLVRLSSLQSGQPVRTYTCEIEMPVEITIVDEGEAETVGLTSSPGLDDAIWDAFSLGTSSMGHVSRAGPAPLECKSLTVLCYKNLPVDVAFQATLRVSDSLGLVRYTGASREFRARAGSTGTFRLGSWVTSIDTPGTYEGTLVLTADPNVGYVDPAIKRIWDGDLEFPVAFTVSEQ